MQVFERTSCLLLLIRFSPLPKQSFSGNKYSSDKQRFHSSANLESKFIEVLFIFPQIFVLRTIR